MGSSVGKKKRFDVFHRDGFTCQYCGARPPAVVLEIDHVIPVSAGGNNGIDNLITSCFDCNRGKSATDLSQPPPSLPERVAQKKERAAQVRALNRTLLQLHSEQDAAIERIAARWYSLLGDRSNRWTFGDARRPTVRTFLGHLAEAEIIEAVEIAHGRFPTTREQEARYDRTWRYFCGVCWRKIKGDSRYATE